METFLSIVGTIFGALFLLCLVGSAIVWTLRALVERRNKND